MISSKNCIGLCVDIIIINDTQFSGRSQVVAEMFEKNVVYGRPDAGEFCD